MNAYLYKSSYVFYILILKACKLQAHDGVKYFLEYSAHHILIVSLAFMESKIMYKKIASEDKQYECKIKQQRARWKKKLS